MQYPKECICSQDVRRKEEIRLVSGTYELKLMTTLFFAPLNITILFF